MFQTFFSEIFSREDWLVTWDHVFMNEPDFMYYVLIAYLRYFRTPLMGIHKLEDFQVCSLFSLACLFIWHSLISSE